MTSPWAGDNNSTCYEHGWPRCCLPSAGRESSPSGWHGRASSCASLGALQGRRHQPQHQVGKGPHTPILLQPALPQYTSPHPGDRRQAKTVPAHLSPCQPRGWQMVLLAGGHPLPPGASTAVLLISPLVLSFIVASLLGDRDEAVTACQVMLALQGGSISSDQMATA